MSPRLILGWEEAFAAQRRVKGEEEVVSCVSNTLGLHLQADIWVAAPPVSRQMKVDRLSSAHHQLTIVHLPAWFNAHDEDAAMNFPLSQIWFRSKG